MRHREPLNPQAVRELEAIDRALAGEPVDPDLRELEALVHDVRASAPEMSPALTARLERGLEQGFPPAGAAAGTPKRTRPRLTVLVPAAGTVAAVVVAIVIFGGTDSGPRGLSAGGGDTAGRPAAAVEDAPATAPAEPSVRRDAAPRVQQFGGTGATAAPARVRKVERSVALVLETPRGEVESTADDVIRTVDRFAGIVASSSISAGDDAGSEAVFDLRIPTSRLDDALAALSQLGHVAERRQDLQDITAAFTSTQERLTDARAERRGLLRALGNATTEAQIESLRARLRLVRGQIAAAKAHLGTLQRRASLSTVSLTVRSDGTSGSSGGGWSIGDAGGDALRALEVIAAVALVTAAVALPLVLVAGVILWAARLARARRRENALDAA